MGRPANITLLTRPRPAAESESFYRSAPNYCRDTFLTGMMHPGKRCYREIPAGIIQNRDASSGKCDCGCSQGNQVCFDNAGGIERSPDRISPVNGMTPDKYCTIDPVCGPMHLLVDVLGFQNKRITALTKPIRVAPQLGGEMGYVKGPFYTQQQLANFLAQAGWPASVIPKMAAIGMAESGGGAGSVNPKGEHSVGIWQININPSLRRSWTESQLIDPLFNAKIALQLYNERQREYPRGITIHGKRYTGEDVGLTHWGAFTDGRYRTYYKASITGDGSTNLSQNTVAAGGLSLGAVIIILGIFYTWN